MGQSFWVYEAGYGASASRALEALQEQVLAEGAYSRPWLTDREAHVLELIEAWERMGLYEQLLFEMAAEGKADTFERLRLGGEPRDRVEAVLWSGPDGTNSILEVESVEPVERAEVTRLFGAVHPDVETVRAGESILREYAQPEARYLVAYEEGLPAALFFFGLAP